MPDLGKLLFAFCLGILLTYLYLIEYSGLYCHLKF